VEADQTLKSLLHFGTSSFSNKDWVGPFYPPGTAPADYLKIYAQRFDTVEVDATYYAVPSLSTVEGWARKTPENFLLALKFPAAIVHAGKEARPDPNILLLPDKTYPIRDKFLNVAGNLGKRLGPLLLQFPYFRQEDFAHFDDFGQRLDRFLSDLPGEFRYAVEIRNRHWLKPDLAELCRQHRAALTLVDYMSMPLGDEVEKLFDPVTADFAYLRLIGDRKKIEAITMKWDQEVLDRSESLKRWAGVINRLVKRQVRTYIYINNHYAGHAPATLRKLSELVFAEL
jgi:uncharacterized protein YecE (DUF72 family)